MQQEKDYLKNLLARYQSGSLSEDEKKMISQWLYQLNLEESNLTLEQFNALSKKSFQEISERINPPKKTKYFNLFTKSHAVAASLVFLLGLSCWFFMQNKQQQTNSSFNREFLVVNTGIGENKTIRLSDSSMVILNGMSKLSYPKTFSKDKREVRLEGEAYFEVSKNPDKPFEISANGFDVQVLGTSFNIRSYSDENLNSVSVRTGKVAVVSPLQNQILLAGESVEIENATGAWTKGKINTDDVSKWKDGKLIFNNQSMKSITRVLERKFNVDFVFKNKRIQDKIISLQIKDQSLKNIMSALQLSAEFQYEQNENTITIW